MPKAKTDTSARDGYPDWKTLYRRATPETLSRVLASADWERVPLPMISWAASRKGVCLVAALHGFFRADPMRFNYLHKNEIPEEYRALCQVLDTLCLRINSGFYDNCAFGKGAPQPDAMVNWLRCQDYDAADGQVGRWVFRESVFDVVAIQEPELLTDAAEQNTSEAAQNHQIAAQQSRPVRDLMSSARQFASAFKFGLHQA